MGLKYDSSLDMMVFLHPSVDFTGKKKKTDDVMAQ